MVEEAVVVIGEGVTVVKEWITDQRCHDFENYYRAVIGWVLLKREVNTITQPWHKRQLMLEKEATRPLLQKGEAHRPIKICAWNTWTLDSQQRKASYRQLQVRTPVEDTMEWNTSLPKIICFCHKCKGSLAEVQLLWVVDLTCWCPRCFNGNFQFQIARGLLVHKDTGYIPSIPENSIHILMAKTKIISSSASQMETLPSMVMFEEGTYYPVYANIYKFPNGNLTSAMLLTNGRFVAVGAVILARHDEVPSSQRSSSSASKQTVGTINPQTCSVIKAISPQGAQGGAIAQTPGVLDLSGLTPSLDKNVQKDSEIQQHLEDSPFLRVINPTRITVAQRLAASEDGDFLSLSGEDN